MGLAASQARLLLLTARKSDLEYRAQMISQSKTLLAMQTEELALNYSNSLNNRALFHTYSASATEGNGDKTTELLTYDSLTSKANNERYRIRTADGKILARSVEEANQRFRADGDTQYTANDIQIIPAAFDNAQYFQDGLSNGTFIIEEAKIVTKYSYTSTDADGNEVTEELTDEQLQAKFKKEDGTLNNEAYNKHKASNAVKHYEYGAGQPLSGMDCIASRLDDTDDAAAAAKYEYESLIIQNRDKQLDVELKQIETQQKACESEIDSVKKILQTNVEKSFKTFS